MPTWKQVEEMYGQNEAKVMKKCPLLAGVTARILPGGEIDYYQCDIDIARRWAHGDYILSEEVD